ncbi:CpxP family protein [Vibrio sp. SM6]|uniref:CpxP family protein n=1 Tax=Vibrio agarilyticus TaxID=2726741 RepID=A0A7X8YI38_9VIBR|nr:CpxP family protein [Vibrio agarilyticus]NLS14002.1 CpxP family protein [Vibrio agarilyticus]
MNLKKALILTAVALPLTLTFGTASADGFGGHKGKQGRCELDMGKKMLRQLDLTEAQKSELKTLRDTQRDAMRNVSDAERQTRIDQRKAQQQAVQKLILADTFDASQAQTLAQEMANQQAERRVKRMEMQHKMLSVLTPEQKTELAKLQQERLEKCGEKRGKGRR